MTTFQTVLADVFDRRAESAKIDGAPASARIDRATEAAAIAAAKTGDSDALTTLIYAYAPALRGAVGRYAATLGKEDAQSIAIGALLEACHAVKEGDYLAGVLWEYLTDALATAAARTVPVTIPSRTMKRFLGVLRRADGDFTRGEEIAPSYDLSREAFHACAQALSLWGSLDEGFETEEGYVATTEAARAIWDETDGIADAEDRILAEVALSAVEEDERAVCRHSYGFESYRPKSDAEVAYDLGLSRPTVQRKRAAALSKMRDRLAIDVEA